MLGCALEACGAKANEDAGAAFETGTPNIPKDAGGAPSPFSASAATGTSFSSSVSSSGRGILAASVTVVRLAATSSSFKHQQQTQN